MSVKVKLFMLLIISYMVSEYLGRRRGRLYKAVIRNNPDDVYFDERTSKLKPRTERGAEIIKEFEDYERL